MEKYNYNPTEWVNDETLINAEHLNNIEEGIVNAYSAIDTKQDTLVAGQGIFINGKEISSTVTGIRFELVDRLPSSGEDGVFYLLPMSPDINNFYEEYVWINNKWELIGSTNLDLSDYYTKTETDAKLEKKFPYYGAINSNTTIGELRTFAGATAVSADCALVFYYNNHFYIAKICHAYSGYYYISAYSFGTNIYYYADNNIESTTKVVGLIVDENKKTFQLTSNKVTSINSSSTDTQYPSAKCVYDALLGKQDHLTQYTLNDNTITKLIGFDSNGNLVKQNKEYRKKIKTKPIKNLDVFYLETKKWNGLTRFQGAYVWTDGENIYYSYESDQYVLDLNTSTWYEKTWNGLTSFYGLDVWTDGDNIYYSNDSNQYVLNKSTMTWEPKTWNGLTSFKGRLVWEDQHYIYYSGGSTNTQYVLTKSTSTWSTRTWSSGSFGGYDIWTDGTNIYFSNQERQYRFDGTYLSPMTWTGLTSFYGRTIFYDGETIYCSIGGAQYKLNGTTWEKCNFHYKDNPNAAVDLSGTQFWTDGENLYYSEDMVQCVLTKKVNLHFM